MTWVRIDDGMPEHPKVLRIHDTAALWLHVCALCYCNRNLTDGFVPGAVITRLSTISKPKLAAKKLVDGGLWYEVDGGYEIHDYLDFQSSRERVLNERESGKKRAARSYETRRSSQILRPKNSEGNGVSSPEEPEFFADSSRDPSQPIPSHPTTSSLLTTSTSSVDSPPEVVAVLNLFATADMNSRVVADIRNAYSYRRKIIANALEEHGPAIVAYVEAHPDATPVDVAVSVIGLPRVDAVKAWRELHPSEAS